MSKEIRIALLVIVILVLFGLGLNFLNGKGFMDNNKHYYAVFDQVAGMNQSDPIVVNGYKVGKVGKLTLISEGPLKGKIVADLIIKDEIKIPMQSKAILFSADLLGEMNVKLLLGDTAANHQDGDTISTNIEATLFEEIGGEITPITDKLSLTMDNVNQLFDYEKQNVQSLNFTIENINTTLSTFQETGIILNQQLSAQMETIDRILKNLEQTTQVVNANEANITASLENVKELTGNLKEIDLQPTLDKVNVTVDQLQTTIGKFESNDNSLGALLNERDLYNNLESSTKNLELLLADMKANPGRYIHFSVFGKKEKGVELDLKPAE